MADGKHLYEFTDTSPALTDFVIITGAGGTGDYKTLLSNLAKVIIENYSGSTIGGSAQSIKSAFAKIKATDPNNDGNIVITLGGE